VRRRLAALILAVLAGATWPRGAVAQGTGEPPPAHTPFEVVSRPSSGSSHRLALLTALTGVALVAASFPISAEADRRYEEYLVSTDPGAMEEHFQAAERLDKYAAASLIAGEVLLATAVWLRFVRSPSRDRLSLAVGPERCALSVRF